METNLKLEKASNQEMAKPTIAIVVTLAALLFLAAFVPLTALAMTAHLKENAPKFIEKTQNTYGEMVNKAALLYDVDPKLIITVIVVESEANPNAVSNRGAQGLMQLMPLTARSMGVKDRKNPLQNIHGGTKYLKELEDRYGFDSIEEVLLAFNKGPSRAKLLLEQHSPEEYNYVKSAMYIYGMLDEEEQADALFTKNSIKKFAEEDMLSGLRPFLTRPRTLAMSALPTMISSVRKNEVELEN